MPLSTRQWLPLAEVGPARQRRLDGVERDGPLVAAMERSGCVLLVDASAWTLVEERPRPEHPLPRVWPLDAPPSSRHHAYVYETFAAGRLIEPHDGRVFLCDPSGERKTLVALVDVGLVGHSGYLRIDEPRQMVVAGSA
jgi:hypothetical protein